MAYLKKWTRDFETPRVWHQQEAEGTRRGMNKWYWSLVRAGSWKRGHLRGAIGLELHSYLNREHRRVEPDLPFHLKESIFLGTEQCWEGWRMGLEGNRRIINRGIISELQQLCNPAIIQTFLEHELWAILWVLSEVKTYSGSYFALQG